MPSHRQKDTHGHTVRFVESSTEQSDSIQDWISNVALAISSLPHPAPLTGKSFESEFEELMTKYEVLKNMLDDIEDKMAVLFYQRQRDIETSSSKGKTSEKLQPAGARAHERNEKRNVPTEYSDYNSYNGDHKTTDRTKTRKAKKPKTVEEQNIHINKVLMREAMSR
ncbi:hypothetical protein NW752_001378 [Fusarium irregulare]|uniref:Uncharacterized protein n=1 Tax=Fusarium irregulare TaxID=2494466 RepID=A0A9W8U5T8_9HYPO|nr:hypothetical protein NW766_010959 [Fusarium irregulare]KAJ4026435.1 hypothetical protein NW752_001378 [Fusarium irregulare]